MPAATLFSSKTLSVIDYRCDAGPADRPFVKSHRNYSIAYVRKGGPGLRKEYSPRHYAAFLIDLDGNNIEAVCLN